MVGKRLQMILSDAASLALGVIYIWAFSVTAANAAETKVRLALVLPAEINDLSWNQRAYEAAKALEESGRIELAYSESVPPDAASLDPVISGYGQKGYDLIITHSFTFGKSAQRLAKQYPDSNFAWAGGIKKMGENLADYNQPFYQGYYLVGVLAGGLTKSGVLGGLTGFDVPVCHASIEAFRLGAESVRPDVRVLSTVTGSFKDVAKAKQAALGLADQGADYFMSCGQGVTLGVIAAAEERGFGATGYVGDMSPLAPKFVFASVIWNLEVLWQRLVDDVATGAFRPGKFYSFGVREGGISVKVNEAYGQPIPDTVLRAFKTSVAAVQSGKLEVPFIPK